MKTTNPRRIAPRLLDGSIRDRGSRSLPGGIEDALKSIARAEGISVQFALESIVIDWIYNRGIAPRPEYRKPVRRLTAKVTTFRARARRAS
jgi:hypothetical protein